MARRANSCRGPALPHTRWPASAWPPSLPRTRSIAGTSPSRATLPSTTPPRLPLWAAAPTRRSPWPPSWSSSIPSDYPPGYAPWSPPTPVSIPILAEREYNNAILLYYNSASNYLDLARFLRGRKSWGFVSAAETSSAPYCLRPHRPSDRYDAAELLLVLSNRDLPQATRQMRAYIQRPNRRAAPLFRAHFLLGEILRKSGDPGQAAGEYRAALALASSYRPASEALRRLEQR